MTPKNKEYIQQLRNTINRIEIMVEANRLGLALNELKFLQNQAVDYQSYLRNEAYERHATRRTEKWLGPEPKSSN